MLGIQLCSSFQPCLGFPSQAQVFSVSCLDPCSASLRPRIRLRPGKSLLRTRPPQASDFHPSPSPHLYYPLPSGPSGAVIPTPSAVLAVSSPASSPHPRPLPISDWVLPFAPSLPPQPTWRPTLFILRAQSSALAVFPPSLLL